MTNVLVHQPFREIFWVWWVMFCGLRSSFLILYSLHLVPISCLSERPEKLLPQRSSCSSSSSLPYIPVSPFSGFVNWVTPYFLPPTVHTALSTFCGIFPFECGVTRAVVPLLLMLLQGAFKVPFHKTYNRHTNINLLATYEFLEAFYFLISKLELKLLVLVYFMKINQWGTLAKIYDCSLLTKNAQTKEHLT